METYQDILFELSKKQYEHEFEKKAHFTTWLGLYLTINSVLFGLIYKGIRTEWVSQYARIDICLYWITTLAASIFAIIAAIHLLKAFKFLEYQYLKPSTEYSEWMEQYVNKYNIDKAKQENYLRKVQIEALSKRLGEATLWNRKLNDTRMGELDKNKKLAILGYVCVLIQHFFIIAIKISGV